MARYKTSQPGEDIPVKIGQDVADGSINLYVGRYLVFKLLQDGRGTMSKHLPQNNGVGLQVDKDGRVRLVD